MNRYWYDLHRYPSWEHADAYTRLHKEFQEALATHHLLTLQDTWPLRLSFDLVREARENNYPLRADSFNYTLEVLFPTREKLIAFKLAY